MPSPFELLTAASARRAAPGGRARGFTLIELMIVVVIISVLAVIAVPAVSSRMRDRRVVAAAQEVSALYRNARLRALGRGSAVLVRFTSADTRGSIQILEAVRGDVAGGNAACATLPTTSCTAPAWNGTDSQVVAGFAPATTGGFQAVYMTVLAPDTTTAWTTMDVCFTSMGRAWMRTGSDAFAPLTGVPQIRLYRDDGGGAIGLERFVLIPPNGAARLGTAK